MVTEYLKNLLKDRINLGACYVGLGTADSNTLTELATSGGYARQPVGSVTVADANGVRTITNKNPVIFTESQTDWGTISGYGVYDATSGGHLLFYGYFDEPRDVKAKMKVILRAGQVYIGLRPQIIKP